MASQPEDLVLSARERGQGREEAMREYLAWEINLVNQMASDDDQRFQVGSVFEHLQRDRRDSGNQMRFVSRMDVAIAVLRGQLLAPLARFVAALLRLRCFRFLSC